MARSFIEETFCPNRLSQALWLLGAVMVITGASILIAAASGHTWQQHRATDQNVGWTLLLVPTGLFVAGGLLVGSNKCWDAYRAARERPPRQQPKQPPPTAV